MRELFFVYLHKRAGYLLDGSSEVVALQVLGEDAVVDCSQRVLSRETERKHREVSLQS